MHVLHRPHFPHAATITAAGAALAVLLTLLFASPLSDFGSSLPSGSPAATAPNVQATLTNPGWRLSPFTSLLRSAVPVPWSPGS